MLDELRVGMKSKVGLTKPWLSKVMKVVKSDSTYTSCQWITPLPPCMHISIHLHICVYANVKEDICVCVCVFFCLIDTGKFVIFAAAGLKVLRDNNLIHRDLKPQV